MKFIVDGMLGKLARWLRMLGYDTEYSGDINDDEILEIALKEKRIILTRDYEFFKRANLNGAEAIFIRGKTNTEKLADLSKQIGIRLEIDIDKSRCPKCNTKIKLIPKEIVKNKVHEVTYRFYNEFWQCPKCGQIYWKGSHWKKINAALKEAEEKTLLENE